MDSGVHSSARRLRGPATGSSAPQVDPVTAGAPTCHEQERIAEQERGAPGGPGSATDAGGQSAIPLREWVRPALHLSLVQLTVDLTLRGAVRTNSPICAVVRGLIGQRFRELRCLTGADHCSGCSHRALCDYAQIFDDEDVHAFWLRGLPATTQARAGSTFAVTLHLATPAHAAAPYLEVAVRDALRALAPDGLLRPTRWARGALGDLLPAPTDPAAVHLRAGTPWVLRGNHEAYRSRSPQAPWFALLVGAGIRRVDALLRRFAPSATGHRPRADVPDLADVAVVAGRLRPWSSSRFSHRQARRIPLRGLQGSATLTGRHLDATLPLLRILTVTGVGKATALGLGTLDLVSAARDERCPEQSP